MTEEEYLIVANLTRLRVVDATLKATVFLDAEEAHTRSNWCIEVARMIMKYEKLLDDVRGR